jgi:hypothetical protein
METDGDDDNSDTYREIYGVQLLDDIHNYLPAILYDHRRFRTIGDLLEYVRSRAEELNGYQFHESQAEWVRRRPGQRRRAREEDAEEKEEEEEGEIHRPPFLENIFQPRPSIAPLSSIIMPRQRLLPSNIVDSLFNLNASLFGPRLHSDSPYGFAPVSGLAQGLTHSGLAQGLTHSGLAQGLTHSGLAQGLTQSIPPNFFDPVPIVPSMEQVEAASICLTVDVSATEQVCSICQENYRVGDEQRCLRHCAHMFHKQCIDRWFMSNVRCPLCRHDIREVALGADADAVQDPGLETSHVPPQTRTQVWYRQDWGGETEVAHASTILYSMYDDTNDDSYSESDGSVS